MNENCLTNLCDLVTDVISTSALLNNSCCVYARNEILFGISGDLNKVFAVVGTHRDDM